MAGNIMGALGRIAGKVTAAGDKVRRVQEKLDPLNRLIGAPRTVADAVRARFGRETRAEATADADPTPRSEARQSGDARGMADDYGSVKDSFAEVARRIDDINTELHRYIAYRGASRPAAAAEDDGRDADRTQAKDDGKKDDFWRRLRTTARAKPRTTAARLKTRAGKLLNPKEAPKPGLLGRIGSGLKGVARGLKGGVIGTGAYLAGEWLIDRVTRPSDEEIEGWKAKGYDPDQSAIGRILDNWFGGQPADKPVDARDSARDLKYETFRKITFKGKVIRFKGIKRADFERRKDTAAQPPKTPLSQNPGRPITPRNMTGVIEGPEASRERAEREKAEGGPRTPPTGSRPPVAGPGRRRRDEAPAGPTLEERYDEEIKKQEQSARKSRETGDEEGAKKAESRVEELRKEKAVNTAPEPAAAGYEKGGGRLGEQVSKGEGGYGSYNRGRAGDSRGKIDFSQMTVDELMAKQAKRPGDPDRIFAFGKYQVIPKTMEGARKALGLKGDEKVTPELQERIFREYLIDKKRPAVKDYITGKSNDLDKAHEAMAYEFASIPGVNGRGKYDGDRGGNRANPKQAAAVRAALEDERRKFQEAKSQGKSDKEAWAGLSGGKLKEFADGGRQERVPVTLPPVEKEAAAAGQVPRVKAPEGMADKVGVRGGANFARGQFGRPGENLKTITLDSGKKVTVNAAAAESFKGFLNELEGSGYKIDSVGGFANRSKRGSSGVSQHAYGNAVDVNPSKNPMGRNLVTDMPANVRDMAAKYGLSWGGDWRSTKDAMHFEWMGPEAQARAAKILAEGGSPADVAADIKRQKVDQVKAAAAATPVEKRTLGSYLGIGGANAAEAPPRPVDQPRPDPVQQLKPPDRPKLTPQVDDKDNKDNERATSEKVSEPKKKLDKVVKQDSEEDDTSFSRAMAMTNDEGGD